MRLGDSQSKSYRNCYQRRRNRNLIESKKLCNRLDKLVTRAETFRTGNTRAGLLRQADKVREKLRQVDH